MGLSYTRDDALQDALNYIYANDCDKVVVVAWKSGDGNIFNCDSSDHPGDLFKAASYLFSSALVETINNNPTMLRQTFDDLMGCIDEFEDDDFQ